MLKARKTYAFLQLIALIYLLISMFMLNISPTVRGANRPVKPSTDKTIYVTSRDIVLDLFAENKSNESNLPDSSHLKQRINDLFSLFKSSEISVYHIVVEILYYSDYIFIAFQKTDIVFPFHFFY